MSSKRLPNRKVLPFSGKALPPGRQSPPHAPGEEKKIRKQTVSRVLSWRIIYLGS